MSPFVVAAVGLTAAGLFSVMNRQFTNYAKRRPAYLRSVEGRPGVAAVLMVAGAAIGSALITFLSGGSLLLFVGLAGTFIACGAAFMIVGFIRQRK